MAKEQLGFRSKKYTWRKPESNSSSACRRVYQQNNSAIVEAKNNLIGAQSKQFESTSSNISSNAYFNSPSIVRDSTTIYRYKRNCSRQPLTSQEVTTSLEPKKHCAHDRKRLKKKLCNEQTNAVIVPDRENGKIHNPVIEHLQSEYNLPSRAGKSAGTKWHKPLHQQSRYKYVKNTNDEVSNISDHSICKLITSATENEYDSTGNFKHANVEAESTDGNPSQLAKKPCSKQKFRLTNVSLGTRNSGAINGKRTTKVQKSWTRTSQQSPMYREKYKIIRIQKKHSVNNAGCPNVKKVPLKRNRYSLVRSSDMRVSTADFAKMLPVATNIVALKRNASPTSYTHPLHCLKIVKIPNTTRVKYVFANLPSDNSPVTAPARRPFRKRFLIPIRKNILMKSRYSYSHYNHISASSSLTRLQTAKRRSKFSYVRKNQVRWVKDSRYRAPVVSRRVETDLVKAVTICGVRFHVSRKGHSLVREASAQEASDVGDRGIEGSSPRGLPSRVALGMRSYVRGGDKYVVSVGSSRYARRIVKKAVFRYRRPRETAPAANKQLKLCIFYSRFGRCTRGDACPWVHDASRVRVCTRFLRGTCAVEGCPFSHRVRKEKVPVCRHYLLAACKKGDACPYLHAKAASSAPLCADFQSGWCSRGDSCTNIHINARRCNEVARKKGAKNAAGMQRQSEGENSCHRKSQPGSSNVARDPAMSSVLATVLRVRRYMLANRDLMVKQQDVPGARKSGVQQTRSAVQQRHAFAPIAEDYIPLDSVTSETSSAKDSETLRDVHVVGLESSLVPAFNITPSRFTMSGNYKPSPMIIKFLRPSRESSLDFIPLPTYQSDSIWKFCESDHNILPNFGHPNSQSVKKMEFDCIIPRLVELNDNK